MSSARRKTIGTIHSTMMVESPPPRRAGTKHKKGHAAVSGLMLILLVCLAFSVGVNFLHGSFLNSQHNAQYEVGSAFARTSLIHPEHRRDSDTHSLDVALFGGNIYGGGKNVSGKPVGHLDCSSFGGPLDPDLTQEMVYWQDIQKDDAFVSPFWSESDEKFLSFEPDGGGFNNIRMGMETVLTMSIAMGRTLVLPPEQRMYLLNKGSSGGSKRAFSFQDFFPMREMARHVKGLKIITMKEFLERQGLQGKLASVRTGKVLLPPQNQTDYDGDNSGIDDRLNPYLREVGHGPANWNPQECMAAFPAKRGDDATLTNIFNDIIHQEGGFPAFEQYVGHPTSVRASVADRWKENAAARQKLCLYDQLLQSKKVLHFSGKKNDAGGRLLVHSYAFLFFEDWRVDLWMKRFVRDHVRYSNEIQCAAARIVQAIRQYVVEKQAKEGRNERVKPTPENAPYDAFHVRRGDFQYRRVKVEATEMYDVCKEEIPDGTVLYMATDEVRNKSFFAPLARHYDMLYLDNFTHLIKGMNPNLYGMLDQLVASRSRTFFGCWFSTFTGYINRLRGYDSDLHKLPGFAHGILNSYHYALRDKKDRMREYWPISGAL